MFSSNGDDFQEIPQDETGDQAEELEIELEAGPRAERPNFLTAARFVDFDLPPEILEGLDKAGFEYCTPIQAQAIPVAMKGEDIAGQAQTGTGKTTAFLVPLLNRLLANKPLEPDVPRAIIVTPTRELALQIHEDATVLASNTNLRQALVIGGMEYKEQAELLAAGPEIVICTPGRIIDYLQQGVFKTKGIEVAVVDEADRLLDMGFIKDLKYLLGKLPSFTKRQTMLFSATLDERVLELTYQYMNPPQYITAEPDTTTKVNIIQELYHVGREEKLPLLLGLLRREDHQRVIIFVNTKSGVEWLSKKLVMNGFQAEGITGDLPQPKRLKLMEAFKENRLQILVATDVASRGIHVDDVSHVYNYDLPQDAENYVHRIGRTARAGNTGKAVSFGCEDYVFHLEAIENLLGEKIPVFWAEADWFHEDQGGEVHMKERKIDRDRRKGSAVSSKTGRGGDTNGDRRTSRGPAKSQRPGGIFGLSPRIAADGGADIRQTLSWAEAEALQQQPALVVEAIEEALTDGPAVEAAEANGERESGRRRKRRRGRRGRGGENQASPQTTASPQAEPAAMESSAAETASPAHKQNEGPAARSEEVQAVEEAKSDAAQAKKSRKPSPKKTAHKKTLVAEATAETKVAAKAAAESSVEPSSAEPAATEAAEKKKSRYPVKRASETAKAKAEKSDAEQRALATAETSGEGESKKPKRAARKTAPVIATEEAKDKQTSAKEAEAKKTSRSSRKTEEAAEPKAKKTSPSLAKAPKTATPKKTKTEEAPKKNVKSKKTIEDVKEVAEAPKKSSRSLKKTEAVEEKPTLKTAAKKTAKKAESAPKKVKKTKKEDAES